MTDRRGQGLNKREKRALGRISLLVALLCLIFLYFSPGCGVRTYWKLKDEHQALEEDTKKLQQNNIELTEEIERLQKDEVYIEKVAREKYKMLKENEEVYQY